MRRTPERYVSLLFSFELCSNYVRVRLASENVAIACYFLLNYASMSESLVEMVGEFSCYFLLNYAYKLLVEYGSAGPLVENLLFSFELCYIM